MQPKLIKGNSHSDNRGTLKFNNKFNANSVKRIYSIENETTNFKRGWQGHKIESRWFTATQGKFEIGVILINNWENPNFESKPIYFELNDLSFDVLYIPPGYVTCIQAIEENSKLIVMSDYLLGEIKDEFRFTLDTFRITK